MARFSYISADNRPTSFMPRLPLELTYGTRSLDVVGLLDTAAAVNVLPYSIGLELGAIWEDQNTVVPLAGSIGKFEARALVLTASHPQVTFNKAVRLVFAWTHTDNVPILFGQVNFFLQFDVCFYRSQGMFDIRLNDVEGQ